MKNDVMAPKTIGEYIAAFPPDVRAILEKIRAIARESAPGAVERISYQMPALARNGNLIYFAAFKKHIGLFPPVQGDAMLQREIAPYKGEKGNLKFPLDQPMPYALIGRIIKARVKEHEQALAAKAR